MDEQDLKIAVLEREVQGLREQHKEHKIEITNTIEALSDSFYDSIKGLRQDIRDIMEFVNKSKGYAAAMLLASSILGGVVVAFSSSVLQHVWK